MNINLDELRKRKKYILCKKHPSLDIFIWNYNKECQYERKWDEYTIQTRGLITDTEGNIIARPFKKFFNLNETEETKIENLPLEIPLINVKIDGCLGILYFDEEKPCIATRGSFESEQSVWATKYIRKRKFKRQDFKKNYTYLFEIVCSESKIIVDYQGKETLYLLAVINNKTGKEIDYIKEAKRLGFEYPQKIDKNLNETLDYIKNLKGNEDEGVVFKFSNGLRLKIKCEDYLRLHKVIANFSTLSIYECLKNRQNLEGLLKDLPDEFYGWVKNREDEYKTKFKEIETHCLSKTEEIKNKFGSRKEQAEYISKNNLKFKSIIFAMLNDKDYSEGIWKIIRPKFELPSVK